MRISDCSSDVCSSDLLGDTVDRLIRKYPVPVLIVRDRAFEPYHTMLVATDFSESSRVALETAIRFFPDTGLSLFHAYDVPFDGYLGRAEVEKQFEGYRTERRRVGKEWVSTCRY